MKGGAELRREIEREGRTLCVPRSSCTCVCTYVEVHKGGGERAYGSGLCVLPMRERKRSHDECRLLSLTEPNRALWYHTLEMRGRERERKRECAKGWGRDAHKKKRNFAVVHLRMCIGEPRGETASIAKLTILRSRAFSRALFRSLHYAIRGETCYLWSVAPRAHAVNKRLKESRVRAG